MRISTLLILHILVVSTLTAQSYQQIEATEYDASQNRWLTGNGTNIIAQDENGVLTIFSEGNATHGMEVMNGTLFAIYYPGSSNSVKGYDLLTGEEVMSLSFPSAGFLNGMGSDPATDRLWVSDFGNNDIIELDVSDLSNPTQEVVVSNTGSTPNGVVYDQIDDRLVFVSWGSNAAIKEVDLSDYSVNTIINSGLMNIDGIDMNAAGDFFISSWSPTRITQYPHDFSSASTVTVVGLSNPADISYGNEINTLGVANSGNETLSLIEFTASGLESESKTPHGLEIFPNPVSTGSRISFDLSSHESVLLNIRDVQGRQIVRLVDEQMLAGQHQVLLNGLDLEKGMYLLEFRIGDQISSAPFVVTH